MSEQIVVIELSPGARPRAGALACALAEALGVSAIDIRNLRPCPEGVQVCLARDPGPSAAGRWPLRIAVPGGGWVRAIARLPTAVPRPPSGWTRLQLSCPSPGDSEWRWPGASTVALGVASTLNLHPEHIEGILPRPPHLELRIPTSRLAEQRWPVPVKLGDLTLTLGPSSTSPTVLPDEVADWALSALARAGESLGDAAAARLASQLIALAERLPEAAKKKSRKPVDESIWWSPLSQVAPAPSPGEVEALGLRADLVSARWWRQQSPNIRSVQELWAMCERLGRGGAIWFRHVKSALPAALGEWMSRGPVGHAQAQHTQLAQAWLARRFEPELQPLPAWLSLPAPLLAEAAATLPPPEIAALARRLERMISPPQFSTALKAQGRTDTAAAAAAELEQALRDAGSTDIWRGAGGRLVLRASSTLRRYPAVRQFLPSIPPADAHNPVQRAFLACLAGRREEAEEAVATVERALAAANAPGFAAGWLVRAELAAGSGEDAKARQALQRAADIPSVRQDAMLAWAALERFVGRPTAALAVLERSAAGPARDRALASCLFRLGRWQQAHELGPLAPRRLEEQAPEPLCTLWPQAEAALGVQNGADALLALAALGFEARARSVVHDRVCQHTADEAETLLAARWAVEQPGPDAPSETTLASLADRVALAAGLVLPGAEGLEAAQAAGWVQQLWERAKRPDEAKRARAIRREVLERSLESGRGGELWLFEWLSYCASGVHGGGLAAWDEMRDLTFSLWDEAHFGESTAAAAAELLNALQVIDPSNGAAPQGPAHKFQRSLDERLPETERAFESMPESARRGVWRWCELTRGASALHDARFIHAEPRRLILAEQMLIGEGKVDDAATIAAALLRRRLPADLRHRACTLARSASDKHLSALAHEALEREVAFPISAEAAAASAPVLWDWDQPEALSSFPARAQSWIEQTGAASAVSPPFSASQAVAIARLWGHAAALQACVSRAFFPSMQLEITSPVLSAWAWAQAAATLRRQNRMDFATPIKEPLRTVTDATAVPELAWAIWSNSLAATGGGHGA